MQMPSVITSQTEGGLLLLRQSSAHRVWGSPLPLAPTNVQADVLGLTALPGAAWWDENGHPQVSPHTRCPTCVHGWSVTALARKVLGGVW